MSARRRNSIQEHPGVLGLCLIIQFEVQTTIALKPCLLVIVLIYVHEEIFSLQNSEVAENGIKKVAIFAQQKIYIEVES